MSRPSSTAPLLPPTSSPSSPSSRRSSLVSPPYRYSLTVGSVPRFPSRYTVDEPSHSTRPTSMTTFPFPHPSPPSPPSSKTLLERWHDLLTKIFAGPHERQLLREEDADNTTAASIISSITSRPHSYGSTDPYGYRELAGPLLPEYSAEIATRRRERRRQRARARFECMASWTIYTVSIVLGIIVVILLFSFYFPDKLDIPNA
ncbi:uncharacterized protein PAN0_004d2329 [Moesziomyces antarcticus]|uniref:Uncharacterized protein n=2 Tax=Pseudozyma antarctica TaxID=84753 RepID=A0A081CBS4_PSEA2|nr:uncharacterized protein PAN0_004d2329 [Moesziomyces antarcticus]GAK64120.1 hypothetical protein PAN0_004d2329 [Moesziomyces antarcticus]SPO44661.1 uncharacterized protein PSANT_02346 [Moesziomyces antarcticus]